MSINFNIAAINQCAESEGPHKRLAIWFQGCIKQCIDCCNADLRPLKLANIMPLKELVSVIKSAKREFGIEGVTYLGGEPLLQKGLSVLSQEIKLLDLGVILFTGYKYKEIPKRAIRSIDLIIDGKFENDNLDNERNLIGSKNQKLICLTNRYAKDMNWFFVPRIKHGEINVVEKLVITGDVITAF